MIRFQIGALPFLLILAAFGSDSRTARHAVLCHDPGAVTEPMARFVSDPAFIAAHEQPEKAAAQPAGKPVQFKAADGSLVSAVEFRAAKATNRWVFVIHEWWGLNDWVRLESARLFTELGDVNVLALDLYDGKSATAPEEAGKLMQSMKRERGEVIIQAALAYAGTDARIATIGWCFGGGWSLQASLLAGRRAAACVMYYGMPEENTERLKTLQTNVLFVLATQDKWITPQVAAAFETRMKEAGKSLRVSSFDADHAFANPSNPRHNAELAGKAFREAVDFIKSGLK